MAHFRIPRAARRENALREVKRSTLRQLIMAVLLDDERGAARLRRHVERVDRRLVGNL